MQANEVIYEVLADLNEKDPANPVRYKLESMMKYLTSAMRQIVLMRPDANSETESVELAAGQTKQAIPVNATQFLGVIRNMGSDGNTPGYPITVVNRDSLDAVNALWHTEDEGSIIDHYTFNEKTPDVFFVTPRPAASVFVEVEYSKSPVKVTDINQDIDLGELWAEPMREYIMYRAYSKNKSSQEDQYKAKEHLSRFYLLLGEESKARLVFSPNADNGGEIQR